MDTDSQQDPDRTMRFILWLARHLPGLEIEYEPKSKALQANFDSSKAKPKLEKIPFTWKDIQSSATPQMIVSAFIMLSGVTAGIYLLRFIPFLRISILSLIRSTWNLVTHLDFGAAHFIPMNPTVNDDSISLFWAFVLTSLIVFLGRFFIRKIPVYAMWEEQEYRQGCESWSNLKRRNKCVRFGFAHLINIWYSIASCVVLALGGGIFMYQYLREYRRSKNQVSATKSAAALHAIYNGIAVSLIVPVFLYVVWAPHLR